MSVTDAGSNNTADDAVTETPAVVSQGHHESPQQRHQKEHMATWLLIAGDGVFFALEIFFWFYLRTLNVNGMWRGTLCTTSNPCTDGLGNPITHAIEKASPSWTAAVAILIIASAAFVWIAEVQVRQGDSRRVTTPLLAVGALLALAAIVVQFLQFQYLPFTTIDGAYASVFEFFMGSNIAHFLIVLMIVFGAYNRSRKGIYEQGHWYQVHLIRLFTVWVAFSATVLALIAIFLG
ncbi:MAG: hypothetical protein WCI12_05255 [Actinomycetes bacterium]